jgi:hypothetical protein
MRRVTIHAVIGNRFMLVHERAALLGVAGIASGIDTVTFDKLGSSRPVNIVAIGAAHFPLGNRMVRRSIALVAYDFMAAVTNLGLYDLVEHFVTVGVNLVAAIAGNISSMVLAANPHCPLCVFVMAGLTNPAALRCRRHGCLA